MIKRSRKAHSGRRKGVSTLRAARGSALGSGQGPEHHALTMLETIPDGLVNLDQDYRFLYVNPAAERIIGQSRDNLLGKFVWDEFGQIRGTSLEEQLRRAVEEGAMSEFEGSYSQGKAEYQILICPCRSGAMMLLREATEKKRLREALEENIAWRKLIIENVKDFAIYSVDVAGKVTLWNPGAEKMYG